MHIISTLLTTDITRPCPRWCRRHSTDPDGVTLHLGETHTVTLQDADDKHDLSIRPDRVDLPGKVGDSLAVLSIDSEAVEVSAAELRRVAVLAVMAARDLDELVPGEATL